MALTKIITQGITDDDVTAVKINDGAVTAAKLASGVGGKILQVLTTTDNTVRTTSSTSFVTASNTLSIDITPSSTSSKIFVMVSTTLRIDNNAAQACLTVYRESTNLGNAEGLGNAYSDNAQALWTPSAISVLDSPSSTSELTYQVYLRTTNGSISARINQGSRGTITIFEVSG